jgi:predicted metal-binding membrane protein
MEHFVTLMVSEWYQRSDKKKLSLCLCQVSISILQPTAIYFKEPVGVYNLVHRGGLE